MKYSTFCLFLLTAWATACNAQTESNIQATSRTEFGASTNGLIYSARTMSQLRHIVDSLNLKHKVCELRRAYRSNRQGHGHYMHLEKGNLDKAREALAQNITLEAFRAQFPEAEIDENLLVVIYNTADKEDGNKIATTTYRSIPFNGEGEHSFEVPGKYQATHAAQGHWVVSHVSKSSYADPYIEAFYFPTGLTQMSLPAQYANLVQYADCLIDTTAQIYFDLAKRTGRRYVSALPKAETAFMKYVHAQTQRPSTDYNRKLTEVQMATNWRAYQEWDSLRLLKVDQLAKKPEFRELLERAVTEATTKGNTNDEFEEYVARYYSPKKALEFKRSRVVVGGCSQDDSPRRHALGIAQLSAETVNWETFLRAHLDIMNDRFERVSDGSYAWAGRKTYLRELEELDINVADLMLGITLRIDNASTNHYFGSLGRLGRALSETQQPRELEQRLLNMVSDASLDTHNRVLAYYLFLNYNSYLKDKEVQRQNVTKLNTAVQKLPAYLVARASVKDKQ